MAKCPFAFQTKGKWRQTDSAKAGAMTINKAQRQTLRRVGVIGECFTHGQLYVAASRVGNPADLRFAIDANGEGEFRTRNIVFREALMCMPPPPPRRP